MERGVGWEDFLLRQQKGTMEAHETVELVRFTDFANHYSSPSPSSSSPPSPPFLFSFFLDGVVLATKDVGKGIPSLLYPDGGKRELCVCVCVCVVC